MSTHFFEAHERGILFVDGRPRRWLEPGRHHVWSWFRAITVERIDLRDPVIASTPERRALLPLLVEGAAREVIVPQDAVGLVRVDGQPRRVLPSGRWLALSLREAVLVSIVAAEDARLALPDGFLPFAEGAGVVVVTLAPYERAVAYVNGVRRFVLGEGTHALLPNGRELRVERVDLRARELAIVGQEVMTADKVTLRLSLSLTFRVDDPVASVEAVTKLEAALYTEAQLAARRALGGATLDTLLEQRSQLAGAMQAEVAEKASAYGVVVARLDLKDVMLPGEIKTLLNRVLEAEKQAAAANILRREETAATRSLANTAKLLEQSPVLMRLKELEAYKEMAAKVGTLTVVAGSDRLAQVLALKA